MRRSQEDHEAAALAAEAAEVELTLYVNGASDLSARAIANARRLCDDGGPGGPYRLLLLDVAENIGSLRASQVLAIPTLVKTKPLPVRKVVGDLSHRDRVLLVLGLESPPEPATEA